MNILITGGAGFIGSTLTDKLLKQDERVIVIDNFNDYYDVRIKENNVSEYISNASYKLYRGDICDRELVRNIFSENKIDCVIHIAARAGVRPSLEDPLEYVRSNIDGTVNILENMRKNNCKKIVFASSSSIYGNCTAEKFDEDLKVTEPISPYAATKSACEQFLYTYSKLYGIQALCLRFFTVYGPKQRPDLAIRKFIELIEQDKPIPVYGDGTTMRDYTYIDDIVDGILKAISYNKTLYEIINLGGGTPITLNQMIETIEKVLGKKAKINRLPMQPGDVNKTVSDITKAKKLLGYNPQTSFEDGIRKFVEIKIKKRKISKIDIINEAKYKRELTYEEKKYFLEHEFERRVGYKLNLDNPKSFNEKIQWYKLNYQDPLMTKCADKVGVREYIKEKIGEDYLVPCLGIYNTPDEIDFEKLPNQFVMKVNWGSGQNIIVKDKTKLNIKEAKQKLNNWLKPENNNYFGGLEWVYKDIKPKIIIEKFINEIEDVIDYKFFCYNSKPLNMFTVHNRSMGKNKMTFDFFDKDFNLLPFMRLCKQSKFKIEKPLLWNEMLRISEILSKPFPFVRVDFYMINDQLKVGELTFYPGNGIEIFEPIEWDYKFGEMLELPPKTIM